MDLDDNEDGLAYPIRSPPTSEQVFTTAHTEFGHCANEEYRTASAHDESVHGVPEMDPPYFILMTTYISYLLLIVLGHVRDFFGKRFYPKSYEHLVPVNVSLKRRDALMSQTLTISRRATRRSRRISTRSTRAA